MIIKLSRPQAVRLQRKLQKGMAKNRVPNAEWGHECDTNGVTSEVTNVTATYEGKMHSSAFIR